MKNENKNNDGITFHSCPLICWALIIRKEKGFAQQIGQECHFLSLATTKRKKELASENRKWKGDSFLVFNFIILEERNNRLLMT